MNNESVNFSKIITTVSNTATANTNYPNSITNSSATSATQFSSISSSSSVLSSSPQTYSNSAQFDVTVNAIAAVVNASHNLPVTTPPNAAAVVAVAVSSLAAAFIPDTPIVSIAGSTLSEITTTTTSTKTTPTPIPTSKETDKNSNNTNANNNRNLFSKNIQNKSSPSSSSPTGNTSSLYSTSRASVKGLASMSVANSSITGALTNASNTAANADAVEIKNNTSSIKQLKDISIGLSAKGSSTSSGKTVTKSDSVATATEPKSIIATASSSQHIVANTNVSASKTEVTTNQTKSKDTVSESWEESRLKDWDDSKLKELLDEAYSYKNPRDKENKSKTFLQLLEKAENEDQSYPFCVTSRGNRNLSNSIASNSCHHYQQNSHYHSHSHNNNNRSHHHHHHHHHKQGGSLQDLFEIGLHESPFECDQTFGIGISGNQRTRRQNHNSRQKKYSSSVSSRQREGGSLPSNVNVTHQLNIGVSGSGIGVINDISLLPADTNTNKSGKKEQRRNAATKAATVCSDVKDNSMDTGVGETVATNKTTTTTTTHPTYTASGGDFIIDMGEPIMKIQQQQKILSCKDEATQGHPFYERLTSTDKRIPRANIISSTKPTYFAPTTSHCYVDETVRFNALERNGSSNNGSTQTVIDAKYLPLDENYKSCKSVLGSDGDKSPERLNKIKTNTIYTKIPTPASGSTNLTGATNNIATLTQRQLDENGNALSEIYQNSSGTAAAGTAATIQINSVSPAANAALLNSSGGNVSTSATVTISPHTASTTVSTSATVTTTFTSGPSQAKAKAKKKSQQERNTKTVDVESVAGYRGKDPVEELVKYIESSGEDKQTVSKSSADKKKERKKDKEKHQKLKKSNSLEELRSGAKMEVHELKRTAATTESNAVLVRQKSGGGGGGKKNNSASTADINKNLDGKNASNPRKTERRSWGNEDLKYAEDQQNSILITEDNKSTVTPASSAKEKKNKIIGNIGGGAGAGTGAGLGAGAGLMVTSKEEKEIKDKTMERNERNLVNNLPSLANVQTEKLEKAEKTEKSEKSDKLDKFERSDRSEKIENKLDKRKKQTDIPPNAVTVVDILAIESVLPETAEFHVVTKKKKPKKQKIINNLEETTVTFNRTHNFTMQKTSSFNQQQQQMTVRYKYYHHDNGITNNNNNNNSNNTGNSTNNSTNANSQSNQQPNTQLQQQQHHQQTFIVNNNNNNHNQQQQHNTTTDNYTTSTTTTTANDKSRRKSTSSVPPSEKSDSSDLDSVHSLPIEATTKANQSNVGVATSHKIKMQTRTKTLKNNNNNNNNTLMGKAMPAPISYADIARTNKEIADAAANTGSASVILINNNEISLESRSADAASLTSNEILSCDEKLLLVAGGNNHPPSAPPTNLNATNLKIHKIKKSQQIKQDFPELSSSTSTCIMSEDHKLSTSNNHKTTITYSQSVTAVQNMTSNQNSVSGNCAVNESCCQSPLIVEHNTKVSPIMEQQKNIVVHQQPTYIPPLQHPQQQILQKSKSVENDNIIINSSTTPSLSTMSSNAVVNAAGSYSMNNNNLDQQYPALEKTFKRHTSLANVTTMAAPLPAITNNNSQQTPFNFAAAAKQQINNNNNNSTEQYNINLNKNSNLTTSNTHNNNNNNNNINPVALSTIANKRCKEKSPPLADNVQLPATLVVTAQITNPKRTKRERQQLQQQQTFVVDNNPTKQNQKKVVKNPLKTSNSLPLGLNSSTNATSISCSSSLQNRPAVIILNDYRNTGSCSADNQFTFGDFNEEELKLFDDDHNTNVTVVNEANLTENFNDINLSQSQEEETLQSTIKIEANLLRSPDGSIVYLNDSGTSCGNDVVVNNLSSEILLSSSIEASSPNNSFNHNSNYAGLALHMPVHNNNNNNQSSDSGIYTDKTKSTNSSSSSTTVCKSTNSNSVGSTLDKQKQKQAATPNQKEEENDNKLDTFLLKGRRTSSQGSMDNLPQAGPPPQQLETCNDIETAIIAAARAAAKQQQPNQHQQQQYKNSKNSTNSSSFSPSSSASSAYHQQHNLRNQQSSPSPPPPSAPQHHQFSHSNNSNKYGRGAINHHLSSYHHQSTSYPQQQQQYDENYINNEDDHDDAFSNNTPRSRSPSRPRRISIAGGTVANKEFDIHFIPPTTMPTAFTTQQHNDIIVDFIGSAWEEVANSKVTKVYDGQ